MFGDHFTVWLQPLGDEMEADEVHQLPRVGVAGQVQLQLPPICSTWTHI